ncbi:MAG TPA: hypothetical protein VIH82_05095 [Acidimicrobiia bacterium]|jgi:hypothetical protein
MGVPRGRVVRAAAIAAVVSGAPSTIHALASGRSPLDAVRAAATLVPGNRARSWVGELAAGLAAHAVISLGWTAVLARVLPRRRAVWWGAVAGVGIAALDLGVVARRVPAIAALPTGSQVADHVVFGAVAGAVLSSAPRSG